MTPIPRIIVIDDNPAIHADFCRILTSTDSGPSRAGSEVGDSSDVKHGLNRSPAVELETARQGADGCEKVRQGFSDGRPFAVAFCDLQMPLDRDGLTAIENLWDADPQLQVVICSACSGGEWENVTRRLGHSDRLLILKKPFDDVEVLQIVVSLLEKRRLMLTAEARQDQLEQLVLERTRHLNSAREESEEFLQAIDSILIGVNYQLQVLRWNQRAAETFGIARSDAIGRRLYDLPIEWDDWNTLRDVLQTDRVERTPRLETSFRSADGERRVLGFSCYPVDGQSRGALILGTDLTRQRIVEQQLHQARKLESVGQLAAGVAHEINTPMQYLGDNLDYVKSKFERLVAYLEKTDELITSVESAGYEPELLAELRQQAAKMKLNKLCSQIPEALQDSIDGVKHVSRIVQAMKELSHPGGEQDAPVDVNRVLETTITVSTNEWKYVADVETSLEADVGSVLGFQGELTQVFLNLIVNAAHAIGDMTDEGATGKGLIRISTQRTEGFVVIRISDTGGGIPASIRDRIFDPFFTTKKVGKGTGQGLAIAHSVIVQKHAGRLTFDVEEGVGTTFIIELRAMNDFRTSSESSQTKIGVLV